MSLVIIDVMTASSRSQCPLHIGDEALLQAFAKGEDLLAKFEASPRQCGSKNDGTKFMASYLGRRLVIGN